MEMQWNSTPWDYLRCNVRQVQNQEQTLEVRISDGMPDIGRVICAWGQPILRSKEWRNDGMSITGGVSVWVLYAPEDGSGLQSVEAWLPFQGKWSFQESHREGVIRADCLLRSVDARTLSARKLMVRANVGMLGCAMEPDQVEVFGPGELPEQVFGLQKTYPVTMNVEAGEKLLNLEDTFTPSMPASKILACQIRPVLTEQTAAGGRVVFRGTVYAQVLCLDAAGEVMQHTFELPFAQFGDLEGEYDKDATATISMAVSNLETELTENGIHVKCGLIAQYMIRRQRLLQVMEDVYSPMRKITPKFCQLILPTVLDSRSEYLEPSERMPTGQGEALADLFLPDHPTVYREGERVMLELPGMFGMLYRDGDGALQWKQEPWSDSIHFPVAPSGKPEVLLTQTKPAVASPLAEGTALASQLRLDITTNGDLQIPMVCGMEVGEQLQPDPARPSLLLQRMGEKTLWEVAKAAGSTVEAIWQANNLQEDPMPGQMLLIPVL